MEGSREHNDDPVVGEVESREGGREDVGVDETNPIPTQVDRLKTLTESAFDSY